MLDSRRQNELEISMNNEADLTMLYIEATVRSMQQLSTDYYLLQIEAAPVAAISHAGQFLQLRVAVDGAIDPLLARPISILSVDMDTGVISLLFKVVGRGTTLLAKMQSNQKIIVQGPIGKGFALPETAHSVALVAGGVGMPPLFFFAEELHQDHPEVKVTLFYGGRNKQDLLLLPAWCQLGVEIVAATEDGTYGFHGLVTEPLQRAIDRKEVDHIAACGPQPMLRAVQRLAIQAGINGQLSLEAYMACGVGACLGCVCESKKGRQRVCVDGPVFQLDEVVFDA